ncbi:type II toxin-antitoxin system HicA family toxin [Candidatus Parcubacteria bacterium]|nr:type II toxin-antitoxin system HicA family toxin [Candidatus Parcubacteria bacterium]
MKLPIISGKEAAKRFSKVGFEHVHTRGSHLIYRLKKHPHTKLSIPNHGTLGKGLLRQLVRDAGITVKEFVELKK